MSKLYWQLRKGMNMKNHKCGSIVIRFRKHKYAKLKMETYPCNRWGSGYWRNKHLRTIKNER